MKGMLQYRTHDVTRHFLQAATVDSTPDAITWAGAAVGQHGEFRGSPTKGVGTPQSYSFGATSARIWRWVITDVVISGQCGSRCQPDVAEIEFRHVGNKDFTTNNGTHNQSLILNSTDFKLNAGGSPARPECSNVQARPGDGVVPIMAKSYKCANGQARPRDYSPASKASLESRSQL